MFQSHKGIFASIARVNGTDFYGNARSESLLQSTALISLIAASEDGVGNYSLGRGSLIHDRGNLPGTLVSPMSTLGAVSQVAATDDVGVSYTGAAELSADGVVVLDCLVDSKELLAMALNSVNGAGLRPLDLTQISSSVDDEPTQSIAIGGSATGQIDVEGDTDLYTVDLVAGERYVISLRGTGGSAVYDTYLELFTPGATLQLADDDGGNGLFSLMTITAATTGTYTIRASSFANPGIAATGQYTLDVLAMQAVDTIPNNLAGAVLLNQGNTFGFRETAANVAVTTASEDADMYLVHLEAGKNYQFSVAGGHDYASGTTSSVPVGEINTLVTIFNAAGVAITGAQSNDIATNDKSSSLTFYAPTTGDYYVQIAGFGSGGVAGRNTGGYVIDFHEVDTTGQNPLNAINWNNAANIPTTLVGGVPTAYVYFAVAGENFGENARAGDPTQAAGGGNGTLPSYGWNDKEKAAFMQALAEYSKITGINYVVTTNVAEATFRAITTVSTVYGAYAYPQDNSYGTQKGILAFNVNSGAWDKLGVSSADIAGDQVSLNKGGFAFGVMLHELGHAHGLSHPHDTGGGSVVMPGVAATQGPGSYGVYNMNQGVYTAMSYNEAWDFHPDGVSPFTVAGVDNGWSLLGALDIAELQIRYGQHENNSTDTIYTLTDVIDSAFYETIWDNGGNDTIAYTGTLIARIDLTAATIDYSPIGGGAISYLDNGAATTGLRGGFTIANGVVIENASGGSGNDVLIGNSADNMLTGNAGNDSLIGRGGSDTGVYSGARSDYSVTFVSQGVFDVVDLRPGSPDGTDRIDGIEILLFSDNDYSIGPDGTLTAIGGNVVPQASNLNALESYIEDQRLKLTTIVVTDSDAADTITATLTLSNVAAGALSTGTSGAVTSTFVNGVWTASGALADVNALLSKVKFEPAANFNASFSIDTSITDGHSAPITGTKNFTGTAVNDAPSGSDLTAAFVRGTPYAITVADFGFSDALDGNSLAAVTITTLPSGGRLWYTPAVGSATQVTAGQSISAADIAAGRLTFKPNPGTNGAINTSLTFKVQDNGGTANGGVDTDGTANTLTLTTINTAPTGTNSTTGITSGVNHVIAASEFGFGDVDGNSFASVTITTLPTGGRLLLDGVKVVVGQVVSAADIAAGKLVYQPIPNGAGGSSASLTFQVHDNGGTANGGVDTDQSPNTLTFTVLNRAPDGANNVVGFTALTDRAITVADLGYSDVDGHAFASVTVTTLATGGKLMLSGVAVTAGQVISAADIAAGNFVFSPRTATNASFTFQVHDNGGTAFGGVDTDATPNTLTLTAARATNADVTGGAHDDAAKVVFTAGVDGIAIGDGTAGLSDFGGGTTLARPTFHLVESQSANPHFDAIIANLIGGDASHSLGSFVDAMVADIGHQVHDLPTVQDVGLLSAADSLNLAHIGQAWAFDTHI